MEPEDVTSSPHSPPAGDEDAYSISYSTLSSRSPTPLSPVDITPNLPLPHEVIRLIQCARCSRPFRTPLRLPCGNTVCRSCLPPVRPRTGVSYPASEERRQGFTCQWGREDCGADHCLGDCGVDVTLTRLADIFQEVLGSGLDAVEDGAGTEINWKDSSEVEAEVKSANIGTDLVRGVYDLVASGRLGYDASVVRYDPPVQANRGQYDRACETLKGAVRNELDCQVCYSLILDPLTTPCGHTFCRSCVTMALSHSNLCPFCRRKLNMTTSVQSERINKRLSDLIQLFLPDAVASRRADLGSDLEAGTEGKIPLFVTSLSFPTMPMALHIFEPRYRLMIQRVMESRSRKFGMVMPNRRGRLQQGLGRAPFLRYGTVLVVDRYELLPDGRSLVIATGMSRFRVVSWELVDGYHVGKVQRVDDVPISEEEAQESRETSAVLNISSSSTSNATERSLESMSTQQLFQFALDFVLKERRQGAPWLHPRVLLAYGALPTDPAIFPWWLATILPIWDEEKYALLSSTTVRQRLKVTARWIKRLESRPCPFSMSVSVSFGPGGAITHFGEPGLVAPQGAETYLSQTLVLGLFLAIFATQVAVNAVQAVRTRRRARVEGARPVQTAREPNGTPTTTTTEVQDEDEGNDSNPVRDVSSDGATG
ncbi:PUA-like domain-containing protein [Aspergillus keveii]|uniref:PUA-like domain-containing protein n=1 Tax=Aspergillus keveii TaxID=714993 RepID=A0ABR4GMJ1_9EURO